MPEPGPQGRHLGGKHPSLAIHLDPGVRPSKWPWRDWRAIQAVGKLAAVDDPVKAVVLRAQRAAITYGRNMGLAYRTRRLRVVNVEGVEVFRVVAQFAEPGDVSAGKARWAGIFDPDWRPHTGQTIVCPCCGRT